MTARSLLSLLGATLLALGLHGEANARYCGAARYTSCAAPAAAVADTVAPALQMATCYRTVQETVWEPQTFTSR